MSQNGLLLITANVGSIFEDVSIYIFLLSPSPPSIIATCYLISLAQIDGLSRNWTKELLNAVDANHPKFIALHCQEFGGKNYEKCMTHFHTFDT